MNNRIKELAKQAGVEYTQNLGVEQFYFEEEELEEFAMLVIQDYENDKRESRRDTMSELGYSRIGQGNI